MKILVTAFKPFNNEVNNHSMSVLKYIDNVDKEIIDVVYDKCYTSLNEKYNLNEYDLIVALGEARNRSKLMIEMQAVNECSASIPDNNGVLRNNQKIIIGAENIIKNNINLYELFDHDILSVDAGKYVCNNLYYHLLYNYPNKSLFIHIPNCTEEDYIILAKQVSDIISIIVDNKK